MRQLPFRFVPLGCVISEGGDEGEEKSEVGMI